MQKRYEILILSLIFYIQAAAIAVAIYIGGPPEPNFTPEPLDPCNHPD